MARSILLFALFTLMACPKKSAPTTPTGDVPAGNAATAAGSMADAPTYDVPKTVEIAKPSCNQDSYFKVNVPAGKAFTVDVKASAGCGGVAVLNQNGGSAGDNTSVEACAESGPKSISGTGQEGATFISVKETGACGGNTITIDIK